MKFLLITGCAIMASLTVACEEHRERNQNAPAVNHVPPNSPEGTPPPENPPPVTPTTGSKGAAPTGTR